VRLVAKGFSQRPGIEFSETWAPTGRSVILHALFALTARFGWEIWGFDISTAFLNGELSETLYMKQLPGFDDGSVRVWLLKRPLYGLRQAANAWWLKFAQGLSTIGFAKMSSDLAIYMRGEGEEKTYIFTHVDDGLCFGPRGTARATAQSVLKVFPERDLGEVRFALGLFIERDWAARTVSIS
jgi:hypothetical protein